MNNLSLSLIFHNNKLLNGPIHYIIEIIFLTTFVQKRQWKYQFLQKKCSIQRQTFQHPHNCLNFKHTCILKLENKCE